MVLQDLGKKITGAIRKLSEAPVIDDDVGRSPAVNAPSSAMLTFAVVV